MSAYPTPCIHSPDGGTLCDDCQLEFDIDPDAYQDFGAHPMGIQRWQDLEAEIEAYHQSCRRANVAPSDAAIPF